VTHLGEIGSVPPQQIWDGIVGRAFHGDKLTLGLVELKPGIHLPEHAHPNEQLGMVIEGSITFTVGDETRELRPGGTWRIPGGTPHTADVGVEGAIVIDVFAPPRVDWKQLETLESRQPLWPAT
jgi:quercetin dioxygenase-like cupin family protein